MRELLGRPRVFAETKRRTADAGVATGLAWTPVGGDILFIEATAMPGSGHLTVTGQLGDVMKESAQAAVSYVRAHSVELGLPDDYFAKHDMHIHVPAGAIPKDGPSAGVTMATAVASLVTGLPVSADVAMTGEVTLTGQVLPIGGLKEKTLAAQRAGITTVIMPARNEADLEDVPEELRKGMTFVPVERVEQVWKAAMGLKLNGRRRAQARGRCRAAAPADRARPSRPPSPKAAAAPKRGGRTAVACGSARGRRQASQATSTQTAAGGVRRQAATRPPLVRHAARPRARAPLRTLPSHPVRNRGNRSQCPYMQAKQARGGALSMYEQRVDRPESRTARSEHRRRVDHAALGGRPTWTTRISWGSVFAAAFVVIGAAACPERPGHLGQLRARQADEHRRAAELGDQRRRSGSACRRSSRCSSAVSWPRDCPTRATSVTPCGTGSSSGASASPR